MCQQRNTTTTTDQTLPGGAPASNGCSTSQCDACKRRGFEQCPVVTRTEQLTRIDRTVPLADSILTPRAQSQE
jgi:hypothetical protein